MVSVFGLSPLSSSHHVLDTTSSPQPGRPPPSQTSSCVYVCTKTPYTATRTRSLQAIIMEYVSATKHVTTLRSDMDMDASAIRTSLAYRGSSHVPPLSTSVYVPSHSIFYHNLLTCDMLHPHHTGSPFSVLRHYLNNHDNS